MAHPLSDDERQAVLDAAIDAYAKAEPHRRIEALCMASLPLLPEYIEKIRLKLSLEIACVVADAWHTYEGDVTPATFDTLCAALRHLDSMTGSNPLRKVKP